MIKPCATRSYNECSHITSRVKRASPVHRMLSNKSPSFAKLYPHRTNVWSSGMRAIDGHKVLRGPSIGLVPILMRYYLSFTTALVPKLQLRHSSLVGVRTIRAATCKRRRCYTFHIRGTVQIIENHWRLDDINQITYRVFRCISTRSTIHAQRINSLTACHIIRGYVYSVTIR